MGALSKPRFPELWAAHPLAKGLIFAYPFVEGCGAITREPQQRYPGANASGVGRWVSSPWGPAMDFQNAAASDYIDTGFVGQLKDLTLVLMFNRQPTNTFEMIIDKHYDVEFQVGATSSSSDVLTSYITGTETTATSVARNAWHHAAVRRLGAEHKVIVDSGASVATTGSGSTTTTGTHRLGIAHRQQDQNSYAAVVALSLVTLWGYGVSTVDLMEHFANPWEFLRPPTRRTFPPLRSYSPPVAGQLFMPAVGVGPC